MLLTDIKLIISGNVLEKYTYDKDLAVGFKRDGGYSDQHERLKGMSKEEVDKYFEEKQNLKERDRGNRRIESCMRARNNIRRLALNNFGNHSKFITLTYKKNMQDLQESNKLFKTFILNLKRNVKKDIKYIAVIEFQERGAIHYHMICDIPYTPHEKLAKWWKHGSVNIQDISKVDNVGAYLIKYMTKNVDDERLVGEKSYLRSRNLDAPVVLYGEDALRVIESMELDKKNVVYSSSYNTEMNGVCNYTEYNLQRNINQTVENSITHKVNSKQSFDSESVESCSLMPLTETKCDSARIDSSESSMLTINDTKEAFTIDSSSSEDGRTELDLGCPVIPTSFADTVILNDGI